MITQTGEMADYAERDALLVVGPAARDHAWLQQLRAWYPAWSIDAKATFLSAVAEAARRPFRAVVAHVDPSVVQYEQAIAGLREAAGSQARLILCCTPEREPFTRQMLRAGADDYIISPPPREELDRAVGYARPDAHEFVRVAEAPSASMEELSVLGEVLAGIDARPTEVLQRLARLVQLALDAKGATVIVEGAVATSGDVVVKPVLNAPISGSSGVIGQLTVGERREGAYSPGDAQKLEHYATVAGQVLQAASKHRRLRDLAVTDECSGLPNRRYLFAQLDRILEEAARLRFAVTVLLFDIDNFKAYNDRFGHDVGDEIIRTVGGLFRRHCRERDVVARFGGDEFVVVFWDPEGPRVLGSEHPDCALTVLDRVRNALRHEPFDWPGMNERRSQSTDVASESSQRDWARTGRAHQSSGEARHGGAPDHIALTISGGLATYPWDATTRDELLRRADEALLSAKRAGKNRVYLIGGDSGR